MSASIQAWALSTARTGSAAQRLALFRMASFAANDDPETTFSLDDLINYLSESEEVVRSALNELVRTGYIAHVRPSESDPRSYSCTIQFNLDDEYVF